MGPDTGTIFEQGGQETVRHGSANFSSICPPPTFKCAHPGSDVLGGQKRIVAHPNS